MPLVTKLVDAILQPAMIKSSIDPRQEALLTEDSLRQRQPGTLA